jgi:hypothetical protein
MGLGHEKMGVETGPGGAMMSRLSGWGYSVAETSAICRTEPIAIDTDFDFDTEDDKN